MFRCLYKDSFSKKNATISNFFLNKKYVWVEKRFGTLAAFYLIFVIFCNENASFNLLVSYFIDTKNAYLIT